MDDIKIDSPDGFADISFPITKKELTENNLFLTCTGSYENKQVDFTVSLPESTNFSLGENFEVNSMYEVKFHFKNDSFKKLVASTYKIKTAENIEFKPEVNAVGIVMGQKPINLDTDDINIKIFFDDKNEKGIHAEAYLNILNGKSVLLFKEKDLEYRDNLIKNL
jgi:hypothetical protein